jgi:hypothetical protein
MSGFEAAPVAPMSQEYAGVPVVFTGNAFYTDRKDPRFEAGAVVMAENAQQENVPLLVVDSSPEDKQGTWVADTLRARGAIVLRADIGGIATQRKQGVATAVSRGARTVIGTELEKPSLVFAADKLAGAMQNTDVLVIGRTQATLETVPLTQVRTEGLAGWILQQTHNLPPDALAGPRGFSVAGAEVLAKYPAHKADMNNWIYLYKTLLDAREQLKDVSGIEANFPYPGAILRDELGNEKYDRKRYEQFRLQLAYLLQPAQMPKRLETPQGWDLDYVIPGLDYIERSKRGHEIAALTLGQIIDLNPETPTNVLEARISAIEEKMQESYGYAPLRTAA